MNGDTPQAAADSAATGGAAGGDPAAHALTSPAALALLARVGEAVAAQALAAQARGPSLSLEALEALEALGLRLQAVARVLTHAEPPATETVDLGVAALQARAEWAAVLQHRGGRWDGPAQGSLVLASAPLLKLMLDLLVAHALGLGQELALSVVRLPPPAAATAEPAAPLRVWLRLSVRRPGSQPFDTPPGAAEELHWTLLAALAAHAGVALERQVQAWSVELVLGWPAAGARGR